MTGGLEKLLLSDTGMTNLQRNSELEIIEFGGVTFAFAPALKFYVQITPCRSFYFLIYFQFQSGYQ